MSKSRVLYQKFIAQGMSKDAAFFAVIDHFNEQHWYDRDQHHERIKKLEAKNGDKPA